MDEDELISSMNTHFLESLLHKIGRRDLCIKIEMYYIKRQAKMSDDTKASHKTNHSMEIQHENNCSINTYVSQRLILA